MGASRQGKKEFMQSAHELLDDIQNFKIIKKLNIIKEQKREKNNKKFQRKEQEDP